MHHSFTTDLLNTTHGIMLLCVTNFYNLCMKTSVAECIELYRSYCILSYSPEDHLSSLGCFNSNSFDSIVQFESGNA